MGLGPEDEGEGQGDGDGVACDSDCNDGNRNVRPGTDELCANGIDDDCNVLTPDIFDRDLDGSSCANDCDDSDPGVQPTASETSCNGLRQTWGETQTRGSGYMIKKLPGKKNRFPFAYLVPLALFLSLIWLLYGGASRRQGPK